jgi:hypothetical protein
MLELQFKNNIEKQTKWDEVVFRVEKITDELGKKIDSGIKETIVAFLVNNFNTTCSCEGHLDRGRPYPWLDIDIKPQTHEFKEKESILINQIKHKGYKTFFDIPETDEELYPKFMDLRKDAMAGDVEIKIKIKSLLDNFYSSHKPLSKDYTLILLEAGRIEPVSGAGLGKDNWGKFESKIKSMTPEEKNNYLKNCQDEMKAFTEFLKDKFMKS